MKDIKSMINKAGGASKIDGVVDEDFAIYLGQALPVEKKEL